MAVHIHTRQGWYPRATGTHSPGMKNRPGWVAVAALILTACSSPTPTTPPPASATPATVETPSPTPSAAAVETSTPTPEPTIPPLQELAADMGQPVEVRDLGTVTITRTGDVFRVEVTAAVDGVQLANSRGQGRASGVVIPCAPVIESGSMGRLDRGQTDAVTYHGCGAVDPFAWSYAVAGLPFAVVVVPTG